MPFFGDEGRNIAEAYAFRRNCETAAREVTIRLRNRRRNFHADENHFDAVRGQAARSHGDLHEIRYRDDAASRAIPRHGKGIRGERKFDTARDNQGNKAVRPRQPCGGESVRFVGVDHIHSTTSHQPPDRACGGYAPEFLGDFMDDDARFSCPACEQRILERDQFGCVAALQQTTQEQKRLILPATKVPAEVHNQRAHPQASP